MPTPEPGRVERYLRSFRQRVLAGETEQVAEMAERWYAVEQRLEAAYLALAREVDALRAAGQPVNAKKLTELARYRSLIGQAQAETSQYQAWAANLIAARQRELARMGIDDAAELIRSSYLEVGSTVARFDFLPIEAVETMIGYAGNGSPLYDLLIQSYPQTVQDLTSTLVQAVAKGDNPRKTARKMANAMGGNLERSLTVARTEQLRTYRTTATEQMKASGVVEGWYWRSAKQTRTCAACLAMDDGVTIHDLDEDLTDHPRGRCFKQPAIKGLEPVQMQSGTAYFQELPEDTQRRMLGKDKYEAWQNGQFAFADLAKRRKSAEWGTHVSVASLKELVPA